MVARSARDASHRLWHLCFTVEFMLCQVPNRLWSLSVGQGSWGIPGETHSWEVIEFEGKRQHREKERIVQTQWISRKWLHHKRTRGGHCCTVQGECFIFQTKKTAFLLYFWHTTLLQITTGGLVSINMLLWICLFHTARAETRIL